MKGKRMALNNSSDYNFYLFKKVVNYILKNQDNSLFYKNYEIKRSNQKISINNLDVKDEYYQFSIFSHHRLSRNKNHLVSFIDSMFIEPNNCIDKKLIKILFDQLSQNDLLNIADTNSLFLSAESISTSNIQLPFTSKEYNYTYVLNINKNIILYNINIFNTKLNLFYFLLRDGSYKVLVIKAKTGEMLKTNYTIKSFYGNKLNNAVNNYLLQIILQGI